MSKQSTISTCGNYQGTRIFLRPMCVSTLKMTIRKGRGASRTSFTSKEYTPQRSSRNLKLWVISACYGTVMIQTRRQLNLWLDGLLFAEFYVKDILKYIGVGEWGGEWEWVTGVNVSSSLSDSNKWYAVKHVDQWG